jgi:branched-chain amino acid transport system substrate-binding protein
MEDQLVMRFLRNRPVLVLSFASAAALAVSACGSGGGGGSTAAGKSPVHIDVLAPLTGANAEVGIAIAEGAKAAQAVINANGGILGHQLVIDRSDTQADAADAVPALKQEIAVNNPVALDGPITYEIHAVQPIFDRNHIVDGWNGGDPHFDKNTDPWLWRCNPSDSQLGVAMAVEARSLGYTTAAFFGTSDSATETLAPVIGKAFTALGGQMLGTVFVVSAQSSYRSEVTTIVNLHPQVIFTSQEPVTAAVSLSDFRELDNLAIPFIGDDLSAGSDFIKAIGAGVAKQHFTSLQGSDVLTANGQQFLTTYKNVNGHLPLSGSEFSYDCVIDFALAMTKAGSTDPNVWVKSIIAVSNPPGTQVSDYKTAVADIKAGMKINYQGASGPMDFNQYHNVTGAWDVVRSNGDAAGDIETVRTIAAAQIQQAILSGAG